MFQQLSSIPETSNSEDMQEFLALNSDVCTYFGRKPFGKSRIDKVGENTVLMVKRQTLVLQRKSKHFVLTSSPRWWKMLWTL